MDSLLLWCPGPDSNGHDVLASADFKSAVSTNFTIEAIDGLWNKNAPQLPLWGSF